MIREKNPTNGEIKTEATHQDQLDGDQVRLRATQRRGRENVHAHNLRGPITKKSTQVRTPLDQEKKKKKKKKG